MWSTVSISRWLLNVSGLLDCFNLVYKVGKHILSIILVIQSRFQEFQVSEPTLCFVGRSLL